jgi:hypothetical protein
MTNKSFCQNLCPAINRFSRVRIVTSHWGKKKDYKKYKSWSTEEKVNGSFLINVLLLYLDCKRKE